MAEINDKNIKEESLLSSSLRGDGGVSVSQSSNGSIAEITSVVVVCEKNGTPISARHFNLKKGEKVKLSLGSDMLASMPDRVIFDLKVNSSVPVNESGFGGMFSLGDPPVLFNVPPNSPLTAIEMMGMVGANQARGIVTVTLSPIWRRGYFPFSMAINLVDPTTPGRISTVPKNILDIYTDPRAGNFFDSLDAEIRESNGEKFLSIIENRREEIQEIVRSESSDPGQCGKPCVNHTANINQVLNEKGDITTVDLTMLASSSLPPSYEGFIIEDGVYGEPVTSSHSYRGNSFRQVSTLSMSMYNFNNNNYAYDQLVSRKILCSGTNENRSHPLIDISDPFDCIKTFEDSNVPVFQFRNDVFTYGSEANSFSSRVPYLFFINAKGIKSSNRIVRAINFSSRVSSVPVTLTMQLLSEKSIKLRGTNDVGIIFTTTVGRQNESKSFSNFIRIKTRHDTDPYGYKKTFGSGKSLPDQGWPHYDVTVGDFYELIVKNIAGTINGSIDDNIDLDNANGYRGGQSSSGLFPNFAECGIPSPDPYQPIISVDAGEHLSACYGLPAHRIWMGNTDESSYEALTEVLYSTMSNLQGSPFLSMYCRGPEKSFELDNFTLAMPLARGCARAFLRSEIKEYADHARDGDFENLRANRFYPLRSISDAVDFLRHGSAHLAKKLDIKSLFASYLNPAGLASGKRSYGERRECIGTSNIGISVNYSHASQFTPHRFYQELGSYFISAISQTEPFRMGPSNMSLSASQLSRNKDGLTFLCYSPGRMFTSPLSGLSVSAENDINISRSISTGGEWHVLYSTLVDDYFGGVKYRDYGINKYNSLDPFIHDANASLKSEGGLPGSSKRKVYINTCIDFGGYSLKPTYENIGYDLDDFCRSTGRYAGNVQRFVKSDSNGSMGIPASGDINIEWKVSSSYPFDNFDVYSDGKLYKNYTNTFGNMLESFNDGFGWSISCNPSSTLAREDRIPFDLLRLELLNRVSPPIEEFPEPYSPYSPYSDYFQPYYASNYYDANSEVQNKVLNNNYIDPYAEKYINTNNPYSPYEPYISPSYTQASIFLRSYRTDNTKCDFGNIVAISISRIMTDSRYFDFNLSDRKNRTISNLIKSFEDRMGPFGVHARASLPNPEGYISESLLVKPRENILDTNVSVVTNVDIEQVPIPTPEDSNPYGGPIYDEYGVFVKYQYDFRLNESVNALSPYHNPYISPYIGDYAYNYIPKPKPVFNVNTNLATFDIAIEVIDPTYSGAFAIDFDFNVARRASSSNAPPVYSSASDQRPRNDPAIHALISGSPVPVIETPIQSSQAVDASYKPYEIAGENTTAQLYNKSMNDLQEEYNMKLRRQS